VVHTGSFDDAMCALRAGADALAHIIYKEELTLQKAAEIAEFKVPISPTLLVWDRMDRIGAGELEFTDLDRQVADPEVIGAFKIETSPQGFMPTAFVGWWKIVNANRANRAKNARMLYDVGVPIMVGTDSTTSAVFAGPATHLEMKLLSDAGIPNGEILLGATSRPAKFLKADPDFGTIEPGKAADLLLVTGNPLKDITATQKVSAVIQGGRIIKRLEK
jgi:imidazolonepropionase-like amidohydrolase